MMRLYEGQTVYVKKEHLDDFLPNGYAEKYDSLRKRRAKVLEWKIDGGPGVEDPMMVRVQMLEDGETWFLPSRMIYCLPEVAAPTEAELEQWNQNAKTGRPLNYNIDRCRDIDGNVYTYHCYYTDATSDKITIDAPKIGNFTNKYTKSYERAMAKGEFRAMKYAYKPLKIIYNDPATIVFWRDGTKTVVKRMEKEKFNLYTAFCAALAKKLFGSNSAVNRIVNSGYNQLVGDILKAGKKVKTKEKAEPKFVRDEKGRWVSTKAKKKKK